ncbi:hypothetical protein cypCar_00011593 [Cyprinus carpio]|nr:hypothetical protein cypCar_00011593 [Cyprinus carpio]
MATYPSMSRTYFPSALFPQGAAVEDGRLRRGDQLLTVNGQNLEGVTHSEAVELLRQTSGTVTLQLLSKQLPTC